MIKDVFRRRVRGFRVIELAFGALLILLAFGVYLAKTDAGRERARIAQIERQIADEKRQLKLLRAEVAHLEQPQRLEQLSSQLGLQAVDGTREARPETLRDIVAPAEKAPSVALDQTLPPAPPPTAAAPVVVQQ